MHLMEVRVRVCLQPQLKARAVLYRCPSVLSSGVKTRHNRRGEALQAVLAAFRIQNWFTERSEDCSTSRNLPRQNAALFLSPSRTLSVPSLLDAGNSSRWGSLAWGIGGLHAMATTKPSKTADSARKTRRQDDDATLKLGRDRDLSTAPAWIGLPDLSGVDLAQTQTFPVDKKARPRKRRWGDDWRELVIGASPYNRVSGTAARTCIYLNRMFKYSRVLCFVHIFTARRSFLAHYHTAGCWYPVVRTLQQLVRVLGAGMHGTIQ